VRGLGCGGSARRVRSAGRRAREPLLSAQVAGPSSPLSTVTAATTPIDPGIPCRRGASSPAFQVMDVGSGPAGTTSEGTGAAAASRSCSAVSRSCAASLPASNGVLQPSSPQSPTQLPSSSGPRPLRDAVGLYLRPYSRRCLCAGDAPISRRFLASGHLASGYSCLSSARTVDAAVARLPYPLVLRRRCLILSAGQRLHRDTNVPRRRVSCVRHLWRPTRQSRRRSMKESPRRVPGAPSIEAIYDNLMNGVLSAFGEAGSAPT
jgi:hypothetical protein